MTLAEIKNSIQSINKIIKITSALRMISAALIYKTQTKLTGMRPYSIALSTMIENIRFDKSITIPWITGGNFTGKDLIVVITSDRGLCGSFNTLVTNEVEKISNFHRNISYDYICIGKVGLSRLSSKKKNVLDSVSGLDKFDLHESHVLIGKILTYFDERNYDSVSVISNHFKSDMVQKVTRLQLIPLIKEQTIESDYIFEPDQETVLTQVCRHFLDFQLYACVCESYTTEQTARMLAMDEASRNAADLQATLSLELNKTRQQMITAEISEVVGAAEAI